MKDQTRRRVEEPSSRHINTNRHKRPPDLFERVKRRADIRQEYERLTGHTVHGNGKADVRCPLPGHEDKKPSARIFPAVNGWKCYPCGESGSVIDLVLKIDGYSEPLEAARDLAERYGIPVPDMTEERCDELREERENRERKWAALGSLLERTRQNLTGKQRKHLRDRGLTQEQMKYIGYETRLEPEDEKAAETAGLLDKNGDYMPRDRFVIPVTVHGAIEYAVFYDPDQDAGKYLFPSGLKQPLWGWDAVDTAKPLYLTAGTFGYLSARAAGLQALFGFGTNLISDQLEELRRLEPEDLRIVFDVGEQEQAERLTRKLWPEVKANIVNLREVDRDTSDGYDLNDLWCGVDFVGDRFREELERPESETILEREFRRFENTDDRAAKMDELAPLLAELNGIRCDEYVERISSMTPWGKTNIRNKISDTRPTPANDEGTEPGEIQFEAEAVPEGLVEPAGWTVDENGIFRLYQSEGKTDSTRISGAPILVTKRLIDDRDGTETLRISWRRGDRWREVTVPRSEVMDARQLVNLADEGLPVFSGNAGELSEFLAELEALNLNEIPTERIVSTLGWTDDLDSFVLGPEEVIPEGRDLRFYSNDEGATELAAALDSSGSLDGWLDAVKLIEGKPKAKLFLYAAFCAPLLSIIEEAENPIIEAADFTSVGKTTALRLAGSVWGRPAEEKPNSIVRTWFRTTVSSERLAGMLSGLPLIFDDTQKAQSDDVIETTFYTVAGGRGKDRGTVDGMEEASAWRTALLSTGEKSIASFADDAGAIARTVTLRGSPFGGRDQGDLVNELRAKVLKNYGHAGPEFVRWLIENRDRWSDFREHYQDAREDYREMAEEVRGTDPVATRYADTFAILETTASAVHAHFGDQFPFDYQDPIKPLLADLLEGAEKADTAREAMARTIEFVQSNPGMFYGGNQYEKQEKGEEGGAEGQWWGRWGKIGEEKVGVFKDHLEREVFDKHGWAANEILREWRRRDWIETTSEDRLEGKLWFTPSGNSVRMIVIPPEASDDLPIQ